MLHYVWCGMVVFSVLFSVCAGKQEALFAQVLSGAEGAIALSLKLAAGYAFFCGLLEILKGLNGPARLSRLLSPLIRRLFPAVREEATREAIVMNFTANMLGLGNAATPMGIRAMEQMALERERGADVSGAICLFLVINSTSLQLLPTTVLSLRTAAASAQPGAIVLPTLLCTTVSTVVGSALALLWGRRHG
ncbi:MAG: hypothetical protein PHY12_07765 [Eubacteriales bacterium]|nr:hypothetical protein [Eubacteriales bacterium]